MAFSFGHAAGGAVEGFESAERFGLARRELGLRERALGLQERALADEQRRAMVTQANKQINSTFGVVGELIKGYKDQEVESGGLGLLANGVIQMESGGNPTAIGPDVVRKDGTVDNALGKYGVMRSNLPSWSQEVFGKVMSEEEFLSNEAAQDALFAAKMRENVEKFGTMEDALSVWHSGVPLARAIAEGRADVNMTTAEYVSRATEIIRDSSQNQFMQGISPLMKSIRKLGQKAGIDTSHLERQAETLVRLLPTGIEKSVAEGRKDAAKKVSEAEGLASGVGLTGEAADQAVLDQIFPTAEKKGEFLGLVDALQNAEPGSQESEFIRGRINKLSEGGGFSIQVGPDGSVNVTQGGAAAGGLPNKMRLSGGQLDELRASGSAIDFGVQAVDALLAEIEKDPTKFGAVGTARRAAESVSGIAEDLAGAGISAMGIEPTAITEFLDNAFRFERDSGTDEEVITSLRPSTTRASDVFAQALTYSVARAMQPEGRLLASTIERANDMVKITGARGSRQVSEQLQAIRSILTSQGSEIQRRMEQGVTGTATTPSQPPSMDDLRRLNDKVQSGERLTDEERKSVGEWQVIDGVRVRIGK